MTAPTTFANAQRRRTRVLHRSSLVLFLALLVFSLLWELWIAPLRPGGSWLALKALPLLFPLKGLVAGHAYTYRWTLLLALAYAAEGCVRAYSDPPPSSMLAVIEIALAGAFFGVAIAYLRSLATPR